MTGLLKMTNLINVLAEKAFTTQVDNPSFFQTVWIIIKDFIFGLFTHVYTLFIKILYMIMKWVMTIIDFVYTIVRQLVGINADSSGTSFLVDDDLIFKFLGGEYFLPLMKYMLGFCLVLLIVFTVIGIIKSEYDYTVYGKSNDKKQVFAKTLQAMFLMILVPLIVIGSIIASNALLRTLTAATSLDGSGTSIGSQIYLASSYRANAYRNYADTNKKIPITYNFQEASEDDMIAGWDTDGGVDEINKVVEAYMNMSVWTRGQLAFEMHFLNDYYSIDYIDDITYTAHQHKSSATNPNIISIYEGLYDKGIQTYKPEYYIMADMIEEIFGKGIQIHFKTLEQVYEEAKDAGVAINNIIKSSDGSEYTMTINYGSDLDGLNGGNDVVTYTHKAGATDESFGAVFVCTLQEKTSQGDVYYLPITQKDLYGGNKESYPEYVTRANVDLNSFPIIARGTFTDKGYPTAIRIKNGIVECYRDNLNIPTLLDFFPTISYEKPEGVTEDLGTKILRTGFELITGVNPDELIPYVYYNFDIFNLFSKTTNAITKFTDGGLDVDYYFSNTNIDMENLYSIPKLDLFILVFGIGTVFNIILKAMFGLIGRIFDIVVLIICYPATLALFPLKGNETFSKGWVPNFISKLTGAYGIVIALNLMFILASATSDFALLQPGDEKNSWILSLFGIGFANEILRVLFLLVAFSMMSSIPKMINVFITGKEGDDLVSRGEKTVQDLKKPFVWAGDLVSGRMIGKVVSGVVEFAAGSLPGGAVVANAVRKKKEKKEALESFGATLAAQEADKKPPQEKEDNKDKENDSQDPEAADENGEVGDDTSETTDTTTEDVDETVDTGDDADDAADETSEAADETGEAPDVSDDAEITSDEKDVDTTDETADDTQATAQNSGEILEKTSDNTNVENTDSQVEGEESDKTDVEDTEKPQNGEFKDSTVEKIGDFDNELYRDESISEEKRQQQIQELNKNQDMVVKALNYAVVQKERYNAYLRQFNMQDNEEAKKAFFVDERNLSGRYNEEFKGTEKPQHRFVRTMKILAMNEDGMSGKFTNHLRYADTYKDDYQNYLLSKGMKDSQLSKAIFFSDMRDNNTEEWKIKFKQMMDGGTQ